MIKKSIYSIYHATRFIGYFSTFSGRDCPAVLQELKNENVNRLTYRWIRVERAKSSWQINDFKYQKAPHLSTTWQHHKLFQPHDTYNDNIITTMGNINYTHTYVYPIATVHLDNTWHSVIQHLGSLVNILSATSSFAKSRARIMGGVLSSIR